MAKSAVNAKPAAAPSQEKVVAPNQDKNLPATVAPPVGAVPAHLADRLKASEGRGVSSAREDNIVPLIYVLQKSSPCTDERAESYVPGAKAGELWVRGTEKLFSGINGVEVQPCAFLKCWIEWGPKRGDGFKGRHNDRPDDAFEKEVVDEQGKPKMVWARPNGNVLVETREEYVLIGRDAFVIPFTSTGHTVHRNWMSLMNQFRDGSGKPFDSFARKYRLTTLKKEAGGNSWYTIKAVDAGWVESAEQYDLGLALNQAVMSGEKVADATDEEPNDDAHERRSRASDEDADDAGI